MRREAIMKINKVVLGFVGRLACIGLAFLGGLLSAADNAPTEAYGVGLALSKHAGGFLVLKIYPDSAASLSGAITNGDLIVAVAESNTPPVSLTGLVSVSDAVALIRGPKGSIVRLTIIPQATNISQERIVTLFRGELKSLAFGGIWLSLTNGATAPSVELSDLPDKHPFELQAQFGKFIVLEFWATWCAPCLRMMPQIQNEAERFATRTNVIWLTVSLDDNPDIAAKRLNTSGWNKTVNVWGGKAAAQAFGIRGIPEMFIINRQAKIVYHGDPLQGDALERLLEDSERKP
jgi:thiol-disulfide isomerase/thioredoxin